MAQTLFFFLLLHLSVTLTTCHDTKLPSKFSSLLVFGDSTVDTGNNKYIPTMFNSDHRPYGQDFVDHVPTGRFSNGRLVSDLLSAELGIKPYSPPFLDPELSDDELRTGVNFASAGAGFDDDMMPALSGAIPVSKQVEMFKSYLVRLKGVVGEEEASRIAKSGLVMISAGTNDMVLNFYDIPTKRGEFSMGEYQDFLLGKLQDVVKELYDLGCRNIGIAGLPPIGCIPLQITAKFKHPLDRMCINEQNSDAITYNSKLQKLLSMMRHSLPGSKLAYASIFDSLMDMLQNPQKYGFEETKRGCCGTGFFEIGPLCNQMIPICQNVSTYMFFDAIHPSERVYNFITKYIVEYVLPQLH